MEHKDSKDKSIINSRFNLLLLFYSCRSRTLVTFFHGIGKLNIARPCSVTSFTFCPVPHQTSSTGFKCGDCAALPSCEATGWFVFFERIGSLSFWRMIKWTTSLSAFVWDTSSMVSNAASSNTAFVRTEGSYVINNSWDTNRICLYSLSKRDLLYLQQETCIMHCFLWII